MNIGYFLCLLMLIRIVYSTVSTRCPVRWLERPEGSSCYRLWSTRMKTWTDARATCQARDGDLLKLDSKHEKEWIINQIEKYPTHYEWWIGLQRHPGNDSIWMWTDWSSRNETDKFIQWGSGEPNNHRDSEDCAEIWDNLLNDKNCEQPLQFICERPKDLPMKCDADNGWGNIVSSSNICFKFFPDKVSYDDALATCNKEDGGLITINNGDDQRAISDFLDHEDKAIVWTSYQFDSVRALWVAENYASNDWWIDGTPDPETVVFNNTLCAVIDTSVDGDKNWRPEYCDNSNSFMCWTYEGTDLNVAFNNTLCAVIDTSVDGDKNWRPDYCDNSNSFMCWTYAGRCPYGYIKHKTTCYLLNTQDLFTWNEARGFCNLRSTKLLEIQNDNDWYYILSMLKNHYTLTEIKAVWLGLSGKDVDSLKWDSDKTLGDFEKTKSTGSLQQTQHDSQCGLIDSSKILNNPDDSWQFGDCSESRGVICTVPVGTIVTQPPSQKPRYECPDGYTLTGIKCYRWNPDDPVDWYSAREKCAKEGADLVTIQSEEDQQFLSSFIQSPTWIGLNDRRKEGSFSWLDTTAEVDFQLWLEGEPNNAQIGNQYSENCVAMHYLPGEENHGKWSDYPCSFKARFACEIPAEWNIALGKMASQSSIHQISDTSYDYYGYDYRTIDGEDVAEKAIDGCSTRSIQSSSCCSRTDTENNPWWILDLGTVYSIGKMVIHRRSEEPHVCPDCISQFRDFRVFISNTSMSRSTNDADMVYQEKRDHIPAIIVLYLSNVTTGRYLRIDIPRTSAVLTLCEVKVYEGRSLQKAISSANSNCITDSTKWAGDIRHTVSGKTCQYWIKNVPHNHGYHDKKFSDGTEKDAENFCRDPLGEGQPWCYTTDPDVRWEFCPVPHCYTDVELIDSKVEKGTESECRSGWKEDSNSGDCYWLGDDKLTWADAKSVCESVGARLPLPTSTTDLSLFTGQLSDQQDGVFWLNSYFEVAEKSWVSFADSAPSYILDNLGRSMPSKTMCVVADKSGNIQSKNCYERNVYSCLDSGPFIKYRTSSDEHYTQLPRTLIDAMTEDSVTTYSFKFEFKGYDGATVLLNQAGSKNINEGYTISIGGNISPKSTIAKLGSDKPKYSVFIPNLCDKSTYKEFWIRWTSGKTAGDSVDVGRGEDVGRNVFLQWTDPVGIKASSISIATVTKTSVVYQGYWRFKRDTKSEQVKAVNLALGKSTKQSSSFSYHSGPEKAVDGCTENTYASQCVTHTLHDFEPWWEVDLGQVYPIREVVIYRRGPECCSERLGYFKLIISMLSDSTLEEDVVFKSEDREPPFVMNIPTNGKHGRYVKIYIPGRKEYLELSEVEVYEDLDASKCGIGWLNYEPDVSCFKFSEVDMSWQTAKEFCDGFNSAMVVPKTPTEQLFIYELFLPISKSKSVWLGLNDMDLEGTFVTTDGSPLIYTDWGVDEPNNIGDEDCVSLRMDLSSREGQWNDKICDENFRAVCKKGEKPTTTTATTTTSTTTITTTTTMKTTTTVTEKPITISQGACDTGWVYSPEPTSCFRVFMESGINFYTAGARCLKINSRLASLKNNLEQNFIGEILKTNNVVGDKWEGLWIAGSDEQEEGKWKWLMDNIEWHSSIKWSPGQPSNSHSSGEHCSIIRTFPDNFGELNDAPCDKQTVINGYFCKYDLDFKKCKDGWVYNGETETCYRFEQESPETWNEARKTCSENGGILATIASKAEQLFMKVLVADSNIKGAWVGAHDMQEDGLFQWIDGATWIRGLWAPAQPNNWKGNQNCAMLVVNAIPDALGLLQDDFCYAKFPYICAIKSCKTGWVKFEKNCYLFSLLNLGWEDAKAYCESEGARLLIVDDEKEHNYIRQKVEYTNMPYMWIGARYNSTYGEHRWIDGSAITVNGWGPRRPGSARGCVDYLNNIGYLWNSHWDCVNTKGAFICEKVSVSGVGITEPPQTVTTETTTQKTTALSTLSSTRQTVSTSGASFTMPPKSISSTTAAQTPKTTASSGTTQTGKASSGTTQTSTASSGTTQTGLCGIGWEKDPSSDTCYKFVIELTSWTEAHGKCSEEGGSLVSIVSDQEQAYIAGRLQGISMLPEAMWIGASDSNIEAGWTWIDGQPFAYLNWAYGEPNYYEEIDSNDGTKEGEDCAAILTSNKHFSGHLFGYWSDLPCSGKRGYICKRKVDTKETTTLNPAPDIEDTDIIEIYQSSAHKYSDFKADDLYELGVRPVDTFKFSVKTKKDAHILLQNEKTDFSDKVYLVIISGWGGSKSTISHAKNIYSYEKTGLLSQDEYRWFWISWNATTIAVGTSDQVGENVFLTYSGEILDINYVSVRTAWYTDAYWKIPKGDKYYGCSGVGWLGYRGACFLVVEEQKDWTEANNYCHKEGAELASITDENEQRFLFSQIPQDSYCFNVFKNDTKCNMWAERGECDRNPVWMATNCHLACKHCMHNCRDKYHSGKCREWTELGECEINHKWMIPNCAMSCGVCQGAPTRGYWIGLQSSGMDQSYRWSDTSNVKYTNWNSHQPLWFNLRPRSCVAMFTQNGKWNDGQCTDPLSGFICKQAKMILPFTSKSPFEIGCSMENGFGYGPYCYIYVKEQKSWSDAQKNCIALGGVLTYIGDAFTQAFVASELQNLLQDFWIGLSVTNGNWTWDGKEQSKLTMTHFDKTVKVEEVTDGCFAMATIKPVGLWKLYPDCSNKLPSICQTPRDGFTTTLPPTTLSSTTPPPKCTDGWQPHGQYCYKVSSDTHQWRVAKEICTHYGSSMVSIHDDEENSAVAGMIGSRETLWIGLQDTASEGVFVWEDESPYDFSAWSLYEPNNANGDEDCTELLTWNSQWNDVSCNGVKRFVCKIPRGKAVNEEPPTIDSFPACDESNPDDGWVTNRNYCYFLGKEEFITWHDANMFCKSKRSELASVHSEEEQLFLAGLNSKTNDVSWLGFNDLDNDNRFSWTDGSVVDFTAWASGQPNDIQGGEKCVTLYTEGTWHDYPCNDMKPFICKKIKDGTGLTTIATTTQVIEGGCPSGFNYTFGNKCYFFSPAGETTFWGEAKDKCEVLGGQLTSIHSQEVNDFIALNVFGIYGSVWLGMHDLTDNGRFDWSDNSRLDYTNWAPNEPSSNVFDTYAKEPCVEMWNDPSNLGLWNDVKCYASKGYTCSSFKASSLPVLESQCPEGYMYMRTSCYRIFPTKQTWNQSIVSCSGDGSHMISIVEVPDTFIIKVLLATSGETEVWIGGVATEGKVKWNDGSNAPITVPNTVTSGCLYSSGTTWSSASCSETRASICKLNIGMSTVSSTLSSTVTTTLSSTISTTQTYECRNSSWFLFKGFCYTTVFDLKTFPNTDCSQYGMNLASINSQEENFKIISLILQKQWSNSLKVYPYFWIGLSILTGDQPVNRWTDGGSIVYSNIDGDKGGSKQGCVILMLFTGQWQVVSCTDRHFYICKGPADVVTTTTNTYSDGSNTTEALTQATANFRLPSSRRGHIMTKVPEDTELSGGQIAGIIIGVLGLLMIIGAVVYILRSWTYKNPAYTTEGPSLGFDNALFHKSQDTVDIN